MNSAIFLNGEKFEETKFKTEEELEAIVKSQCKLFFGKNTIYLDIKKKIDSKSLGGVIPDAIMFDFNDVDNPEVYLVEVELASHNFYDHIFPQITKFFAFYRNPKSRDNLTGSIFTYIKSNPNIEAEFRVFLKEREIYKTIKDVFEDSQNILLIIDDQKPEFQEMSETYMDTWGKLVKVEVLKGYSVNGKKLYSLTPDFTGIELGYSSEEPTEIQKYDEDYHLQDVSNIVKDIYNQVKLNMNGLDSEISVNPQRYYISLRKKKNFAYIQPRRKKLKITIGISYEEGIRIIKHHTIKKHSQGVQDFYHIPCFEVIIESTNNLQEIFTALEQAYKKQNET